MALKAQAQFTNPYEAAYQRYSSSPFFDSSDWKYVASGSDSSNLDMYIRALDLLEKRDKRVFDKTYGTEFENSETRLAAIYNEAFASHTANDDRYQIDVYQYDDAGNMLYDETGSPKVQKKTVSEYQYNKMIIRQQNDERRLAHLRQLAEEAKDPTVWADAYGILVDVAYDGILEFFNKTLSLGKTLIDMAASDKTFKNDWFTQWENNYKPILDRIIYNGKSLSEHLIDFESKYSHMRDLDGNLTTFGKYASGVATTIGEVTAATITGGLAAMPLGSAAAGTGTAAKVATMATSAIRTGAYYAPLAAYSMGESYKEITAKGQSVATSKMISNQLWKTGIEIGIESVLGKVFGATGLDKMLFGRAGKVAKKAGKVGTLRGIAHFAGEALQEGAEEFLQEFSGFLVDKAYSNLVDEAFEPEFSVQNLIDAAIIGALVSGVHSSFSVVSTKGKTLTDADGNVRKLGKVASAYYNISMPTFLQNLENAQKSLDDIIAQTPTQQKLQALTKRKNEIEAEIKSVNEQLASFTNKNALLNIGKLTQEVASDIGKGFSLNQSLELVKNSEQNVLPETLIQRRDTLQRSLQSVDSDIANTKAIKQSVDEKVGMDSNATSNFVEAFRSVYAAARAVQSFAGVIGNERMTRVSQILGRIEQMGNDGKFNEAEAVKARNEMIKELQLSGFSVDKGLVRRIKEAKMTKIDQLVTKEDLGDDKVKWANFIKAVLEQTEAETVGITDGANAVKDGKLVLVPEGELKLGAEQVTRDLAEQQLIENLVNGKYAGAPIGRVLDLYKKLSGNNEATEYDAARHLLFDDRLALFKVLLFGDKKDIPLADNNMYRFLVALYEDYNLFLPKTILDEVTKTKLDNIKNKMTNAFIGYLKLQPYADYNVDFLNDAQKQAIKQHTESMAVFNRLVEGKATSSDIAFINKKINALQTDKATKEGLYKMINSKEPTTIRSALFNIDTRYRIAFYGTNNGETYMPVNSIRNRAFNMFLYNNNITIGNIVAEASNMKTMDEVKNYIHNLNTALNSFTSKRYSLRLRKAKTVNTESGQFKLNSDYRIEIVDNDSVLKTKDLTRETLKAVATQKEKTVVYRGSKLTNVIASLVKDKRQAAYYSIDDLVVKPELLSDELQKEITDMYGELTSDSTYQYLRENLPKAVEGLTISLMADGTIGFVNVEAISELLIDDVSQFAITNGIKLEKFLKNSDRVPFLKDCIIELTTGNSDFNIRKLPNGKVQGVIKINANIKNDVTKLRTALAHEVQHAIQFANRLNTGNDGNIYSKLSKKDQESITKELTAQFPKVFEGAKAEDIPNLVNAILYYASGEIAAHGAENAGVINFVPILIQDKDNTTTITLPNGSSYSFGTETQNKALLELLNVPEGRTNFATIQSLVKDLLEQDPTQSLPSFLVDKILETYRTVFHNGKISFISDAEMQDRVGKGYAGSQDFEDGILINRDYHMFRVREGQFVYAAKTILHEMLHAIVRKSITNVKTKIGSTALALYLEHNMLPLVSLTQEERAALALIKLRYDLQNRASTESLKNKVLHRALSDDQEFIAELVNPQIRTYLKKQNLWTRIMNLIRHMIGIESTTALDLADKALITILETKTDNVLTSNDETLHDLELDAGYLGDIIDESSIPETPTNDPEKTIEEIEKELEESKKASRKHIHKHGQTNRSTVRVKASKGTPLEPFAYRQLLVTVQDFIMRHKEYGDIDPTLKRKIDNGTLRKKDIDFYLRNTPGNLPTDAATFKLINEIFYQNEYITSFEQLDEYVEQRSAHYYAIRALFRGTDQAEQLIEKGGPKLYDVFMQLLEDDLDLKKKFDRIVRDYWEINYKLNKGSKQSVDEEKLEASQEQQVEKSRPMNARYLRFLWLSYFDGSVNAGAEAAAVARCMAYAGRDIANVDGSTLPEKAKVKIKPTKDDWELFTKVITDDVRGVLVSAAQQGVTEEAIAEVKAGKKLTMEDLEARKTAITNEILYSQLNDPERFWELWNKYMLENQDEANIRFAQELVKTALGLDIEAGSEALSSKQEAKNTEIDDIIRNELKGKVRNKAAVMRNVRSILSNIQDKLSRRPAIATNNFLKHMDDLIDERLKLKDEAIHLEQKQGGTRLKDLAVLLEYEERLRKASKDITLGIYDDSRYTSRLRAERKATDNLIRKLENAITGSERTVGTGIKIGDETLHIDAEKELPLTIKRLLETEIKRTAKSTTQLFTNDDERHIKMNYKNFITDHAEMLNALTQDQVNEIIEFYRTSGIVADTNRFRAYITIQQLLLGYIYDGNGKATCNFTLNSEQIEFIESRMEFMARTGATMIATWKTVLTKLKLQDEKTKAMLTIAGIELLPEDEKLLIDAINTGDVKQITSAKKEIYSKLVESYRGRKRTVFDRLLRFERMALLSGPGTWIRNEVTNRTLAPLNNLTAILGNLFTKGEKQKARRERLKQYTFTGTQIDQKYADWIENEIIKSGLLEAIGSASIKYNFRATTATVEDQLAKLVKDKIEAELFDKESGANPISRKLQEWITKAMSDDRAVNKSFKRYLGKMLTEDKADISNGLTKEVMDTIAEAYVFAAHDFMHKSNFWMKAENSFKTYLQKHFSPTAADGIYFMYKQVFPFAGASWNWFMEGLEYTPVGLIKGVTNLILLESKVNNLEQARAKGEKVVSSRFAEYMTKRQLGKGIIGSATIIVGVLFAIAGKVELDKDDETYKLRFNTEDGPLYIDVSNLFGTSGFITGMSIAQSFRDSGGKFDYNSFMRCWSTALNTMFLDSSFAELYNTFRYTKSFGEYLAEMPIETAGMFVPNFVKTLGNTFKKYNVIYSPGFVGQLERFAVQSFAPFGYMMPYVVNPYTGEPEVINEGWFGINLINRYTPLRIKNYEFGDVERMAVSVGVKKGSLPGRYKIKDSTISLSNEETELLNQFYGKLNAKDLDDFMSNRTTYTVENEKGDREELTYRKMTDKQKAAVIERIMSNNSGMAKVYVLTSRKGYKYYANDSEYEKLRKAGVLSNVYRKVGKYEGFIKN